MLYENESVIYLGANKDKVLSQYIFPKIMWVCMILWEIKVFRI